MAKLSQKQARRVSFLLNKMAQSFDSKQREHLLAEALEALHIDADTAADSKESAARSLRHDARQQRKAASKPDDIYSMNADELQAHNERLMAKIERLMSERQEAQPCSVTPEPAPVPTEAPAYNLPTQKMSKRLAAFDDLSDDDQIDVLRSMWA